MSDEVFLSLCAIVCALALCAAGWRLVVHDDAFASPRCAHQQDKACFPPNPSAGERLGDPPP